MFIVCNDCLKYGSECWAMKVTNKRKLDCYYGDEGASRDPRSVETRSHAKRGNPTHSTRFTDRRGRLRWFGHVHRRDADNVTRKVMNLAIPLPGTRSRGRPKKT